MQDAVVLVAVQDAVVVAQCEAEALVQFHADTAAREDVIAGIVGSPLETVDLVGFCLDQGAGADRRNHAAEEEQLEVLTERDVEFRADGNVHINLVQAGGLGKEILLSVSAEVDAGAVAEVVREALGILEVQLDAIGVIDSLTLLEIEPGGRTGADADLGRHIRARKHQSRGGEEEKKNLFHGYQSMWLPKDRDF